MREYVDKQNNLDFYNNGKSQRYKFN